jgi:hypothetical protein
VFINGVELATLDRVEQDFSGLLDALEEAVIFSATGGGFLVGMVAKDLLAVSTLDLLFRCLVAVFRESEDCVVILALIGC